MQHCYKDVLFLREFTGVLKNYTEILTRSPPARLLPSSWPTGSTYLPKGNSTV